MTTINSSGTNKEMIWDPSTVPPGFSRYMWLGATSWLNQNLCCFSDNCLFKVNIYLCACFVLQTLFLLSSRMDIQKKLLKIFIKKSFFLRVSQQKCEID